MIDESHANLLIRSMRPGADDVDPLVLVRHVGEAAERGYWNFDSETLDELRRFLLQLHNNN